MQCKEVECIIPSFIKGEESEMVSLIQTHLESCKSCREMVDLATCLSKDLAKLTPIVPEVDFLSKIHNRIDKGGKVATKSTGETTTRLQAVSKSSRHSTSSRYNLPKVELPFFEKLKSIFFVGKLKTPAFAYAFAIHFVVFGFCVFNYIEYKADTRNASNKANDAQSLRRIAFNSATHQSVNSGKININVLSKNGEVYITQTASCIQILLSKPLKGDYIVANVKDGELTLEQNLIDKYFQDSEVSILVFNNAVEVWSKNKLEEYVRDEVSLKPA